VQNPHLCGCDIAISLNKLQRFGNVSKKLIGLGERDNFFDEVRRIKSKMYLS